VSAQLHQSAFTGGPAIFIFKVMGF